MSDRLKEAVREIYGATARDRADAQSAKRVAAAFGYSDDDLAFIPDAANFGLGCGNPVAMASLMPGETVVDLGSGGGIDVFLAARRIGPEGRVIGVDMTQDMIARAQANAAELGLANVEFRFGEIEDLPIESSVVDCVISNCVINLCTDKKRALREIFRILKPQGRLAVSDIVLKQDLPAALHESLAAYVGCIAGAMPRDLFRERLVDTGFTGIEIEDAGADLNVYGEIDGQAACCAPAAQSACTPPPIKSETVHASLAETIKQFDLNDYACSARIVAVKT